jgi:predicted ATPase
VQAIPYWQQAGQRAIERSAHVEALAHLTKGLDVLTTLPVTPEHTRQELDLQTDLGLALMAAKGYAAPEVERAYARARELCGQVGESPQLFPVLWGLFAFYHVRAELRTARELGEQFLSLAQRVHDPALLLQAHRMLGATVFYLGELAAAQAHVEQGIALHVPHQYRAHAFRVGQDLEVACLSIAALALWLRGYPDQARKRSHEALTLAQERAHLHSLAYALNFAALLHTFRQEGEAAQARAEAAMTLSTKQGFPFWLARGMILRGWALARLEPREEGIAQMRQGLAAYRVTGAELGRSHFLALLAEGHRKVGQRAEGLSLLAEALAAMDKTGERFWEAELHRLKGELLLQKVVPDEHQAEACFHQALDVARRQQARSLELRAATSLSRLWQHQGQRAAAHQLLAQVYGWFTEGFDTADLQEAKALLDELA